MALVNMYASLLWHIINEHFAINVYVLLKNSFVVISDLQMANVQLEEADINLLITISFFHYFTWVMDKEHKVQYKISLYEKAHPAS